MLYKNIERKGKIINMNHKSENKTFKIAGGPTDVLAVRCKIIADTKSGVNYLINIEDYAGGITVLLDKDGNPMLSQMIL